MRAVLSEHLPLLVSAPEGIQKLRGLILELAVRGKLVPQDQTDEPANALLQRAFSKGKSSKQFTFNILGENECPFEVPRNWCWTSFESVFSLEYGDNLPAPKRSNSGEFPVYGSNGVVGSHSECSVTQPCIVVGRKGSAGALNLCLNEGCWVTDVAYYCIPPAELDLEFCFKLFQTLRLDVLGKGIKPGLSRREAYALPVPIPPLAEQHRIVAKVDELMALCERLEAEQSDAELAHARLVESLLSTLTQSSDAADLASSWQCLAEHFDSLFNTDASVEAIKQAIVQLAVTGRLVEQDSNDDTAASLLQRVADTQGRLDSNEANSKKRKTSHVPDVTPAFAAPVGWEWRRLEDVLQIASGLALGKNHQSRALISRPYLRVANVQRGFLALDHVKSIEIPKDDLERYCLREHDLLITEGGDWDKVGRTAIWSNEISECLHQNHIFRARPIIAEWNIRWTEMYLNSATSRAYFAGASKQTTNLASINMTQLKACAFPVPPPDEQSRIVAKVDELMALCNRMKVDLREARVQQSRLADTLIEAALKAA